MEGTKECSLTGAICNVSDVTEAGSGGKIWVVLERSGSWNAMCVAANGEKATCKGMAGGTGAQNIKGDGTPNKLPMPTQ